MPWSIRHTVFVLMLECIRREHCTAFIFARPTLGPKPYVWHPWSTLNCTAFDLHLCSNKCPISDFSYIMSNVFWYVLLFLPVWIPLAHARSTALLPTSWIEETATVSSDEMPLKWILFLYFQRAVCFSPLLLCQAFVVKLVACKAPKWLSKENCKSVDTQILNYSIPLNTNLLVQN